LFSSIWQHLYVVIVLVFFLLCNEYYFFIIVHYSNIKASHDQESRDLKLNTSVQTLLETIRLADQNATENSNFIWDLLDPIIRFLLLNQTQVNFIFLYFIEKGIFIFDLMLQ